MNSLMQKTLSAVMIFSATVPVVAVADEPVVLEQRIERLEQIIQGQGLMALLSRVDQLQNTVRKLNGDNEALQHQIDEMKKSQRQLYLDIDQRLEEQTKKVEQHSPVSSVSNSATTIEPGNPPQGEVTSVTNQPTTASSITSPVAVENGEAAYQAALQTLRSGQYEQAITALSAFPQTYPGSSYLPNVYYWRGEANYVLRKFNAAATSFQTVINDYSTSNKVADATLKLGFSQYELGQKETALQTLNAVVANYPDTSAARLAKVRLERIKQEQP